MIVSNIRTYDGRPTIKIMDSKAKILYVYDDASLKHSIRYQFQTILRRYCQ